MKKVLPLLLLACGAAHADDAAILKCRALPDAPSRLACYDAMPVGAAAPAAAPAAAASSDARFGMASVQAKSDAEPKLVRSTVPGELRGWGPGSRITLANGQVWRVIEGDAVLPLMNNAPVQIERSMFGSYFLKVDGQNSSARVKRVE